MRVSFDTIHSQNEQVKSCYAHYPLSGNRKNVRAAQKVYRVVDQFRPSENTGGNREETPSKIGAPSSTLSQLWIRDRPTPLAKPLK
jgi:hypothetical protein